MGVSNNPNSPRQKMINLMYIVFIAMMAMNVSSEVLNGFSLVENSLSATMQNAENRNSQVVSNLTDFYKKNPEKVEQWYKEGIKVKSESDSLFNYIEQLKIAIVKDADGKDGNIKDIQHKDNLDAASHVMLAPRSGKGPELRKRIEAYRNSMTALELDTAKRTIIEAMLNTNPPKRPGLNLQSWEATMFENMPVVAATTILTKMQSDIRYVEGEILSTLIRNIDVSDYRVNSIKAMVIPKSQIVMSGMPYEAEIVLAAVDSTQKPEIYVDGKLIKDGFYSKPTGSTGAFPFKGYIQAGERHFEFNTTYYVTQQTVTIASSLMNMLYADKTNEVEISMPGVPSGSITAEITKGKIALTPGTNKWTISGLSEGDAGSTVNIRVNATLSGGKTLTETKEFRIRKMPPPEPFITYKDAKGNTIQFKGGRIPKRALVEASGLQAAIDDGVLYVPYNVTKFQMQFFDGMGNMIPEVSQGANFTQRQKDYIRNLAKGKIFFISDITVVDPSTGTAKSITGSIQVIVN